MNSAAAGWLQVALLVAALAACYVPLGNYIARIFTAKEHWRVERGIYKLCGIDPEADMRWSVYVRSMLAFSFVSVLFLYLIERTQHWLFLSVGMSNVTPDTAWNTAASFTTNTNWQNYSGESTMSYLTQMSGLAVQNFMSAAVGLVVAIAMIRGFTRSKTDRLGNFWVDVTRAVIRLLLPISVIGALILVAGGAIDNFASYHTITTLSGAHQTIVGGPVASQEVIKELGNNGGGFFNANSAHPFENPNPFTNWFEIFLLLLIPFSLPRTFGKMVGSNRQGYALVAVMVIIWLAAVGGISFFETHMGTAGIAPQLAHGAAEGTETRFGTPGCSLFAASTTVTSTGAVNCFHDSLTPFGGGIALFDIALGEIAPGGIGAGMYGILVLAIGHRVRGRADGRPDAGVHRQEDPAHRDEVRGAVLPDDPGAHADRGGVVDRHAERPERHLQPRPARADRGHVRVRIRGQQQRVGVRGPGHRRHLVPDARRHRDAARPVRAGDLRPGPGRVAGQTGAGAGERRHAGYENTAVRRHARRRDPHPRRPDLLPRARAGTVRRRTALMAVTTTPPGPRLRLPLGRPTEPHRVGGGLLDPKMLWKSTPDAFKKLDPRVQIKNPVMFVVEVGAVLTLYTAIRHSTVFNWTIVVWLFLTVVFANLAEAVAEGRGKAQADTLRRAKRETMARRLLNWQPGADRSALREESVAGTALHARRLRGRRGGRAHSR